MLDRGRGIVCVVGTRPEVVKLAPVVLRLRREPQLISLRLVSTGQHRALLDQALAEFALAADEDVDLMRPAQTPADVLARGLSALSERFQADPPALVMAQGDTTTVLCAALAAFYARIPFAHVEAGLRTHRPDRPFPEESQRVLVSHLAAIHFAPTVGARANLIREGIDPAVIHVTGNTVIDALKLFSSTEPRIGMDQGAPLLLVTAHRRENFGAPLARVCKAVLLLLNRRRDLRVIWPVHPNPAVHGPIHAALGGHNRVKLTEPLAYREFLKQMNQATVILTDSGGVQEEAPALGKPVVVLREETERTESVAGGDSELVGTETSAIVEAVERLLDRRKQGQSTGKASVGDGWAAERIARAVLPRFGLDPGPCPVGFSEAFLPVAL